MTKKQKVVKDTWSGKEPKPSEAQTVKMYKASWGEFGPECDQKYVVLHELSILTPEWQTCKSKAFLYLYYSYRDRVNEYSRLSRVMLNAANEAEAKELDS